MSESADLALYQTAFCPYCERVREALRKLGVSVAARDLHERTSWRSELVAATGRATVPCLRIARTDGSAEWLHESSDIIAYLERRFGS